jgi:tetratricopeptide (TPR) repeat protein
MPARIQEGERYESARKSELEGAFGEAIKIYQTIIKRNPIHIDAVSRLLILYRKTKDRDAEIELLLQAFELTGDKKYLKEAETAAKKNWGTLATRSCTRPTILRLLPEHCSGYLNLQIAVSQINTIQGQKPESGSLYNGE